MKIKPGILCWNMSGDVSWQNFCFHWEMECQWGQSSTKLGLSAATALLLMHPWEFWNSLGSFPVEYRSTSVCFWQPWGSSENCGFVTPVFWGRGSFTNLLWNGAWPPTCHLGNSTPFGWGFFSCVGLGKEKERRIMAFCFVEINCRAFCGSSGLLSFFKGTNCCFLYRKIEACVF